MGRAVSVRRIDSAAAELSYTGSPTRRSGRGWPVRRETGWRLRPVEADKRRCRHRGYRVRPGDMQEASVRRKQFSARS